VQTVSLVEELQGWYRGHCNGEWEHHYGISIETCDNPGWWVRIDLKGTELESRGFQSLTENVGADGFQKGDRWLHCRVKDGVWHGSGDESRLPLIIETFLTWAGSKGQVSAIHEESRDAR
jgi:hypothetical protein